MSGTCPSASVKHSLQCHKQWNKVTTVLQLCHTRICPTSHICCAKPVQCNLASLYSISCISLTPTHQVILGMKTNVTKWKKKSRSGLAEMPWSVQATAQRGLNTCLEAFGRVSYSFYWVFEYVYWGKWSVGKRDSQWNGIWLQNSNNYKGILHCLAIIIMQPSLSNN